MEFVDHLSDYQLLMLVTIYGVSYPQQLNKVNPSQVGQYSNISSTFMGRIVETLCGFKKMFMLTQLRYGPFRRNKLVVTNFMA
jgi:hypothetical protein